VNDLRLIRLFLAVSLVAVLLPRAGAGQSSSAGASQPAAGAGEPPAGASAPATGGASQPAAGAGQPADAGAAATTDRAHTLASQAAAAKPAACKRVKGFSDCHKRYPDGCTLVAGNKPPLFDAYLNFLKNQLPDSQDATGTLTGADVSDKESKTPAGLDWSNHARFAGALADLGEGNLYSVVGYLYYHMHGGKETCNCKLSGDPNIDKHLGVGFDPAMAQKVASGQASKGAIGASTDVDRTSMIVEMTPAYRAQFHPSWTEARLDAAVGKQVKVVGQLLLDNDHLNVNDDCAFAGANHATCWRMSAWELHPVVAFYVCKKGTGCGDDPQDWTRLDDLP
jgi:hypothetical protein